MALKNYTSSVSAEASIKFIERKLVASGARSVIKQYDDCERVSAIMFMIPIDGSQVPFKVPARIPECERVLLARLSNNARPETVAKIPKQAERTAWKIVSDWVEAQMAMIELAQVELMEVFLPYVYLPGEDVTYFESLKRKNYRALLGPAK